MSPAAREAVGGGTLRCRVLTPERTVTDMPAAFVAVDTVAGRLEIFPGFEPTIAPLSVGTMRVEGEDGKAVTIAVHGGYLDMNGKVLVVLADSAEIGGEVDVERARAALSRARELLARVTSDGNSGGDGEIDGDRAKLALLRAMNRLRAAGEAV